MPEASKKAGVCLSFSGTFAGVAAEPRESVDGSSGLYVTSQ